MLPARRVLINNLQTPPQQQQAGIMPPPGLNAAQTAAAQAGFEAALDVHTRGAGGAGGSSAADLAGAGADAASVAVGAAVAMGDDSVIRRGAAPSAQDNMIKNLGSVLSLAAIAALKTIKFKNVSHPEWKQLVESAWAEVCANAALWKDVMECLIPLGVWAFGDGGKNVEILRKELALVVIE